jgi:hypothetical protein
MTFKLADVALRDMSAGQRTQDGLPVSRRQGGSAAERPTSVMCRLRAYRIAMTPVSHPGPSGLAGRDGLTHAPAWVHLRSCLGWRPCDASSLSRDRSHCRSGFAKLRPEIRFARRIQVDTCLRIARLIFGRHVSGRDPSSLRRR